MRIQHNIMAMSAYRNYTNNVSAMKKNLEKLSSGYKINRAGDDAAGLAISEKMRAQITGLETAQKNAKDGISLVQTAEGALTEVHDMLNRMVELATMSANGTYDNDTDRAQLQKEMDQLTSEINRIADSANFNGIKLLDGSMDSKAGLTGVEYEAMKDVLNLFVNKDTTGINQNDPLGGKDIMEKGGTEKTSAGFEIDLDGIGEIEIVKDQKFAITIGDVEMTSDALDAGKYTGKDLAAALDGKTVDLTTGEGDTYTFTAKAEGGKLTFTTESKEDFQLNANAQVGWKVLAAETPEEPVEVPAAMEGTLTATTSTALDGSGPIAAKYTSALTVTNADKLVEGNTITIGTDTYTVVDGGVHEIRGDEVDLNEINTEEGLKKFIAEKLNDANSNYDISIGEDGNLVYEAYAPGAIGTVGITAPTAPTVTFAQGKADAADDASATIGFTAAATAAVADTGKDAVGATKFIKLSDNDDAALAAAAEKAGAADGAKLTIKVDATNHKAQLFAGDKKIGEADYAADGTASTTVTFKDADGNALMKASLVKVEGDEDAIADGFDTGLTYKAASTTTASEDGLMALADDGAAAAKKPAVTNTAGVAAGTAGFTPGTPNTAATATMGGTSSSVDWTSSTATDLTGQDGNTVTAEINGKTYTVKLVTTGTGTSGAAADDEVIVANNSKPSEILTAVQGKLQSLIDADNATGASGTTDYTKVENLALTGANDGTITATATTTAQTYSDGSATKATAAVDFTDLTGADVIGDTVKIGDKTYEFAAADGTVADGNVKVTVAADSDAAALATAFETAVKGAKPTGVDNDAEVTKNGNTVTVSATTAGAKDFEAAATEAAGGTDEPTDPGTTGGNNLVGDMTSKTELNKLDDFTKDIELNADQINELKELFEAAGSGTGEVMVPGPTDVSISLKDIDLTGAKTVGDVAQKIYDAAVAAVEKSGQNYEVVGIYADANYTQLLAGPGETAGSQALSPNDGFYIKTKAVEAPADDNTVEVKGGTINSGLQNVTDNYTGASDQLAHVVVDFSKGNAWTDGAKIKIGDETYTVALGADSKFKGSANVIDLTDMEADSVKKDVAAQRLTVAANGNKTFVVGHDGTGQTVLKQREKVKDSTDMETQEKISKYLGVSTADAESVKNAAMGKGLTLQIGDTAEDFNKLVVNIKDMHAESLGLGDAKISDQDSAAIAIDKIKAAINTVSDVRGTLGATQNRLDHTINNLSVMTENIQDAESTIRDTDVADEMMAYTKNNILIQSAQAMLAQANQVPQGVLQLLQ